MTMRQELPGRIAGLPGEGGREIGEEGERAHPSLFSQEIDTILPFAKKIAQTQYSKEEIKAMAEEAESTIDTLWRMHLARGNETDTFERLTHAEALEDIMTDGRDFLVGAQIISAKDLEKVDEILATRDALADSEIPKAKEYHAQLQGELDLVFHNMQNRIVDAQKTMAERHTGDETKLDERLKELFAIPSVKTQLDEWEEEQKNLADDRLHEQAIAFLERERDEQRTLEEEKLATEKRMITAERSVAVLKPLHAKAWDRVRALLPEKFHANLEKLLTNKLSPQQEQSFLDAVRERLIAAVLKGEGTSRLKTPAEIVPWKMSIVPEKNKRERHSYFPTFKSLVKESVIKEALKKRAATGPEKEQAGALLAAIAVLDRENALLRRLFGNEGSAKKDDPKSEPGPFWRSFALRAEWDKTGKTEEERMRSMEQEVAKRAKRGKELAARHELMRKIKEIDAKKTGFRVMVEQKQGAILLAQDVRKGKQGWKVVAAIGIPKGLVRPDMWFVENLSNAPQWLADAARDKGVIGA